MLSPYHTKDIYEIGVDEVGRGCIAGRVYAATVMLPIEGLPKFLAKELKDSKKLSAKKRAYLKPLIEKHVLDFGIGYCEVEEIDEMNILNATYEAMHRAIDFLSIKPEHILVDGNRFKSRIVDTWGEDIPFTCIVKGDNI